MSPNPNQPRPYSQLRGELIAAIGSQIPKPRKVPKRPAKLDMRLPASAAESLRRLSLTDDADSDKRREIYFDITMSISDELEAIDEDENWYELLTSGRRAIRLIADVEMEVNNGGFDQYYLNSSGDGAILAPAALRAFGFDKAASLVEAANNAFTKDMGPPQSRRARLKLMDKLGEAASELWASLDNQFFDLPAYPDGGLSEFPMLEYVRAHESEFFKV